MEYFFSTNTGREAYYVCYKTVQTGCWLHFHTITDLNSANAFFNANVRKICCYSFTPQMLWCLTMYKLPNVSSHPGYSILELVTELAKHFRSKYYFPLGNHSLYMDLWQQLADFKIHTFFPW